MYAPAGAYLEISIRGFQNFAINKLRLLNYGVLYNYGPILPQSLWAPFPTFSKSVGSLEPTLTTLGSLIVVSTRQTFQRQFSCPHGP